MIRVILPAHLRTLCHVDGEVKIEVAGAVTQRAVLDALEAAYPMLRGTIRDQVTGRRRAFLRFFACEEDLSHESPDAPLPEAVAAGTEPLLVVGAMAGGAGGVADAATPLYGWVIVGVGILVTCVGFGAMLSLSVFLEPLASAMQWSRTGIATAAMLNFLCMGVGAFAWGAMSDRYGTRNVILAGGLLLGLGMVLASRASSLGQFQLLYGVIVGAASGAFYAPMTATTTRWFTRHRSLAVALVSAGLSVGSTVMAPLASWMITAYGWRTAMMALGDLVWLAIVPAAFLVKNPPVRAATDRGAAAAGGPALTIGQVVRTPQFATIALTHFACCAAHSGPIFHMVTHAIDRGVPAMAAATVLSVAGLASLSGKIGCGIFADRVGAKRTLVAGLALQALAISLYLWTGGLASFYALALVFGFAYGGVMPLYAILVREYFGERVMGSAFGAVSLAATLGMALGPWVGGSLYDALGSYAWMFIASAAIGLGAVAIAVTFRPPRPIRAPLASPAPAG